ncbi:hypothetical protein ABZ234_08615 [Nocardiopsis sp. NPDC006198]|uniref:hypothetical protein n=1 Tax=Nocardiopsis sp. NPDC006198 TaxID=3154472 RepID=UPI0033A06C60
MIQIRLGPRRPVDPVLDPLGRDHVGWSPDLDEHQVYEAGRGCWVLGPNADEQDYALITAQGTVRLVVEIDRLVPAGPRRRAIVGSVLGPDHPVAAAHLGRPEPETTSRNPIAYLTRPPAYCRCGCGEQLTRKGRSTAVTGYQRGHDNRALTALASTYGGAAAFVDHHAHGAGAWERAYARAGELLVGAGPAPGPALWARHCLAALLFAADGDTATARTWCRGEEVGAALQALEGRPEPTADQARAWLSLYRATLDTPGQVGDLVGAVRNASWGM